MLISKKYGAGDIVSFKIVTTEEIVAKIVEVTSEGYLVNRPCTIIPSQQGIGLMQSLISADINNDILLRNEHVIMHALSIEDIAAHYIRTTTGVQIAKGGIIT
jgi:predicted Mrr-cat superfamily restriction endonuclease